MASGSIEQKQIIGLIGSLILFVGVFAPIVSMPILGSVNFFQNGKGNGVIILIIAFISLIFTLIKEYRALWFTGLGALAVMLFTFVNFRSKMGELEAQMDTNMAGSPFRGLAHMAVQSVQLEWGWAVLMVGAMLLIVAAALRQPDF